MTDDAKVIPIDRGPEPRSLEAARAEVLAAYSTTDRKRQLDALFWLSKLKARLARSVA